MAYLVDNLIGTQMAFYDRWCLARPTLCLSMWERICDAWGVLTGRYHAVYFGDELIQKGKE